MSLHVRGIWGRLFTFLGLVQQRAQGILGTLGLGVVGALIGGVLASIIGTGDIWELDFLGFVFAVIAAVLLVGTAEAVVGKKKV